MSADAIHEYAEKVVASWPALSREQLDRIAGLINRTGIPGGEAA